MSWKKKIMMLQLCLAFFPNIIFAKPTQPLDQAAITQLNKVVPNTGIATTPIGVLAGQAIQAVLGLVGLIFFGLMVYGGFTWMTARGNDDKVEKARGIITTAVIGIVIIVSAYAITAFITNRLILGQPGSSDTLSGSCSDQSYPACRGLAPGSGCAKLDGRQGTCTGVNANAGLYCGCK